MDSQKTHRGWGVEGYDWRVLMRSIALAALALITLSSCSSSKSDDTDDFARSVDIGGRNIYLTCNGSNSGGAPTVILVAGYHDSSDAWTSDDALALLAPAKGPAVFPALAKSHRVCAYDRPGTIRYEGDGPLTDRSTAVPQPRTAADIVAELHATLAAAEVPGPYVLVGHSLGGLISLLYAKTYPDQIHGIVFVDSLSPTLPETIGAAAWTIYRDQLLNPPIDQMPMPSMKSPSSERVDIDASIAQVQAAPALPTMPVAVMTKTEPFAVATLPPGLTTEALNQSYQRAQDAFVALAPRTPQIFATGSDHYIQFSQPDLVTQTADLIVERATN
jgi:pimeloyl-ACP methyl ester carboxylesterase